MTRAVVLWVALAVAAPAWSADPRLREVIYDPRAVVTVPVKRGVVTLVVLDPGEAITEVAAGLGGDCTKPEAAWCVAAQPGGRHLFVKPKSAASAPNTLAVVTDKRAHSFRFVVLADDDVKQAIYRLVVRAPELRVVATAPVPTRDDALLPPMPPTVPPPSPAELVAGRLQAQPVPVNTNYALAEGKNSADIVPTLVFDDGRFTYFRFPANLELPAVFHVLSDGSETLVNARMEDELLVADRVSRRLMLRAGSAVVGVWNEAFDIDGLPPSGATTVPGLRRVLKGDAPSTTAAAGTSDAKEQGHE